MLRPVRMVAPGALPISVAEVKSALRLDGADHDNEIERLIKGAVDHYEGWTGVLGIAIVEQTWRQDFRRFDDKMRLQIGPVVSIASVAYHDDQEQIVTVDAGKYTLRHDAGGPAYVRFEQDFSVSLDPSDDAPVAIDYIAGWPDADVPSDIKTAIILRVQKHFDEAARSNWEFLDRAERDLISRYRSMSV